MAKATVAKVMEEIKTLTPGEQDQVRKLLDEIKSEQVAPASEAEVVAKLNEYLVQAGLLAPELADRRERPIALDHDPVEVLGKPVSETVIEERR